MNCRFVVFNVYVYFQIVKKNELGEGSLRDIVQDYQLEIRDFESVRKFEVNKWLYQCLYMFFRDFNSRIFFQM